VCVPRHNYIPVRWQLVQPGGKCKESSDCKGESEKNITERKTKLAYLAGGKDLFTLYYDDL
jgi:hypothetical protein